MVCFGIGGLFGFAGGFGGFGVCVLGFAVGGVGAV